METETSKHNEQRKQLWISAWCASIRHEQCRSANMATVMADQSLRAFDERFEPSTNDKK